MRGRHAAPWHLPDAASRITLEPGSFPPPASPGFCGTTSSSAALPARPAPRESSGWRVPRHRLDFRCCSRPPLPCVLPPPSRRNRPVHASFASRSMAASPVRMAGQFPRLQFRGLLGVHSRCGPAWSLNRPRQPSLGAVQTTSLPPSCAPIAAGWNDRCWAASAPAGGHCVAGNRNFPIPGNLKLRTWRLRRPPTSVGGTTASRYLPPVGHGRSAARPHASRGSRMADATPCRHPQVDCNAIVA